MTPKKVREHTFKWRFLSEIVYWSVWNNNDETSLFNKRFLEQRCCCCFCCCLCCHCCYRKGNICYLNIVHLPSHILPRKREPQLHSLPTNFTITIPDAKVFHSLEKMHTLAALSGKHSELNETKAKTMAIKIASAGESFGSKACIIEEKTTKLLSWPKQN